MPTAHWQPMALMEGMKGCGGCHKIGVKSEEEIRKLRESGSYGLASCDACHTRHQFSVKEAQDPQSCRTCHMGIDHPQWEMYSSSKHGVRHQLKQDGTLPDSTAAPTCQFCHMPSGDHGVRTAWGFLAVRLPMPLDKEWASERTLILRALGVLDPQGEPGARFKAVADLDLARLTQEDWEHERARMITVCMQCHSRRFAEGELAKADSLIRESDRLMAEGIAIVADLYTSLVMEKPEWYAYGYADILTFHDAPTVVEQKLFRMFMEHRMRTFQGAFHMNPDYSLWYGWSEMKQDLTEIKELARAMKAGKGK
jgi:cytochrome c553